MIEIKQEIKNHQQIFLLKNKKFWRAFQMSAYLLQKNLWPELKVTSSYSKYFKNDIFRVGFIATSLPKVLDAVKKQPRLTLTYDRAEDPQQIIISGLPADEAGFIAWQKQYRQLSEKINQQMQPFYGSLPIYKQSYDLMSLVISTSRNFPKELQSNLGNYLVEEMITINQLFRHACLEKEEDAKDPDLNKIQDHFNTVTFLLRLAFDQKAYGLERSVLLNRQLQEIAQQLILWRRKINIHEQRSLS